MTGISDNDKRIRRSKKALKQSLTELSRKKNILSITVTDIVENAGYSRGTFYSHYENKEEFLINLIDEEIQNYIEIVFEPIKNAGKSDSSDRIYESVLKLFEHVYANKDLYCAILSDTLLNQTTDYFCDKVSYAIHNELDFIINDNNLDMDIMSYVRVNHYLSLIKYWIRVNFKYSAQYMTEQSRFYHTSALQAVLPKKNRENPRKKTSKKTTQ